MGRSRGGAGAPVPLPGRGLAQLIRKHQILRKHQIFANSNIFRDGRNFWGPSPLVPRLHQSTQFDELRRSRMVSAHRKAEKVKIAIFEAVPS